MKKSKRKWTFSLIFLQIHFNKHKGCTKCQPKSERDVIKGKRRNGYGSHLQYPNEKSQNQTNRNNCWQGWDHKRSTPPGFRTSCSNLHFRGSFSRCSQLPSSKKYTATIISIPERSQMNLKRKERPFWFQFSFPFSFSAHRRKNMNHWKEIDLRREGKIEN